MITAYDADSIRRAEQPLIAAAPMDALMRQAAGGVATTVLRLLRARGDRLPGSTVLLLVGGGDNGGDALYAGAALARRGLRVEALLLSERVHGRALAAAAAAGVRWAGVRLSGPASAHAYAASTDLLGAVDLPETVDLLGAVVCAARRAGVWVDGVTGIGASPGLREPAASIVCALESERLSSPEEPLVVAVDVPSGIGVDDGSLPGPVLTATATVTMGAAKPGLLLPPAASRAGRLEIVDLGLASPLAEASPVVVRLTTPDLRDLWPLPQPGDHKYSRGVLGLLTGSRRYPGAAVLSAAGALGVGVGMVRYDGPPEVVDHVLRRHPEVVSGSGRVQATATGSGIGPDDPDRLEQVHRAVTESLDDGLPVVLDAGALHLVPDLVEARGVLGPAVVLTPHAGELAGLLSALDRTAPDRIALDRTAPDRTAAGPLTTREDVDAEPVAQLRRAVEFTGATVLLKGATTMVLAPGGPVYSQDDGTPWLATAGTGDVLAGVLGALLAACAEEISEDPAVVTALAAAAAAVHGRAARLVGGPLRSGDLAAALPRVVAQLLSGE